MHMLISPDAAGPAALVHGLSTDPAQAGLHIVAFACLMLHQFIGNSLSP